MNPVPETNYTHFTTLGNMGFVEMAIPVECLAINNHIMGQYYPYMRIVGNSETPEVSGHTGHEKMNKIFFVPIPTQFTVHR